MTKQPEIIVAPKHTDLRPDELNHFVSNAILTCWDSEEKKLEFRISFTATMQVKGATTAWNRSVRGC